MLATRPYIHTATVGFALFLIFLATINAALRPSAETPITPFYVLFPFILSWVLLRFPKFRKVSLAVVALLILGIASGYIYGTPLDIMLFQSLKYIQLLSFLGLLYFLTIADEENRTKLLRLAFFLLLSALTIAFLQQIYRFEIPTVQNEESYLWVSTFFYTPNDLALFLGAMFCLAISTKMLPVYRILLVIAMTAVNIRNDSKAVLLACLVYTAFFYGILVFRNLGIRQIWSFPIIIIVIIPTVLFGLDATFDIYQTNFDFTELFIDPFDRIIHFDPYNLGGSIYDRTDALIYNLEALHYNSYIGLGPGGSVYLLSQSNFELLTAKSLHNAIAEFLVEFGMVGLFALIYVALPPLKRALRSTDSGRAEISKIAFTLAAPFLSVSQSSGFISNYAFWLAAFLIWVAPSAENSLVKAKSITQANRELRSQFYQHRPAFNDFGRP